MREMTHTPRLRQSLLCLAVGFVLVLAGFAGCRRTAPLGEGTPTLILTSSSIRSGNIGKQCTCDGAETSPALAWTAPPAKAQSFALIVIDRDAFFGFGSFTHWLLYNLPAETRELPEGLPKQEQLADGSRQGQNDFDKPGYAGPCPPTSVHRYVFTLYALDSKLNLPAGATKEQVESALKGHILARGQLIGRYRR